MPDAYQMTLGELLRVMAAAIERMSVKNPNRVLLDQCAQIIVQQAGRIQALEAAQNRVVLTDG